MRVKTVALRLAAALSIVTALSTLNALASPAAAQSLGQRAADAKAAASEEKKPTVVASKPAVSKKPAPLATQPAKAAKPAKPPKPKKQVSSAEAVGLSREILVKHGYQVVRVETVKDAQVIYYRAGNNGRGRGQGALRKMIIRPYGSIVTFEAAPEKVRYDIKLQIGF
jgi:hypothetical protein